MLSKPQRSGSLLADWHRWTGILSWTPYRSETLWVLPLPLPPPMARSVIQADLFCEDQLHRCKKFCSGCISEHPSRFSWRLMRCNSEPELRNFAEQHGFYKLLLTLFKSNTQTNLNFKPTAETPNSRLYMGVWFWNKSKSEGLVMFCLNCKSSKCCTLGHRCLQTKSPIGVLGWGFSHFSTIYSDTCMPIVGYNRYYLVIYNL